jgi:hypothetical protein
LRCHQPWSEQPHGACRQHADKEPSLMHHISPKCGLGTMHNIGRKHCLKP